MNNQNIEILLERLISVNEQILEKLDDVKYELGAIKEEFNWVGNLTYGKMVNDSLSEITEKLINIESGILSIDINTSST